MKTKDKPQAKQYVIYSRKSKFTGKGESIENAILSQRNKWQLKWRNGRLLGQNGAF